MTQAPQIRVFYSMVIKAMIISSTIKLYIATVPFMAHWRALILSEKGIHKITTEEKGAKYKLIDKNLRVWENRENRNPQKNAQNKICNREKEINPRTGGSGSGYLWIEVFAVW